CQFGGANDAVVMTSLAQSSSVTEWSDLSANETNNVTHTASGAVIYSDVDATDTHTATFVPQAGGYLGSFTINTANIDSGHSVGWSFQVADSPIDYLQAGQI